MRNMHRQDACQAGVQWHNPCSKWEWEGLHDTMVTSTWSKWLRSQVTTIKSTIETRNTWLTSCKTTINSSSLEWFYSSLILQYDDRPGLWCLLLQFLKPAVPMRAIRTFPTCRVSSLCLPNSLKSASLCFHAVTWFLWNQSCLYLWSPINFRQHTRSCLMKQLDHQEPLFLVDLVLLHLTRAPPALLVFLALVALLVQQWCALAMPEHGTCIYGVLWILAAIFGIA